LAFALPSHIPPLLLSFLILAILGAGKIAYAIIMGQIFERIAIFALDGESPGKVVVPDSWLDGVKK